MAKRRGSGEGAIYKRAKDGLWCTSVELPPGADGKRRRKVICRKDKAAVRDELASLKKQLAQHGDIITEAITLEKWLAYWLDNVAAANVRPKTLATHRTVVDGFIVPLLGRKKLSKLTAQDVRKLHIVMQATPKDPALRALKPADIPADTVMLSSAYALRAHNVLSAALKTAHREGKIPANPCEMVDRPRARNSERKALAVEEAIHLLRHLAGRADGPLWATYLLTGARRGEILGLEVDRVTDVLDLSWQLQRITDITRAPNDWEYRPLGGTLYLTRPKSRAGWRIIPLVEPLRSILRLAIGDKREGLVFTRNGRPWDPDGATKAWAKVLQDAGLPGDVVLHGARHTSVDLLYEAGVPEAVISEIVGHSTRAVTRGYKSRGNTKQLTDAMDRMSKLLEQ